MVLQKLPESMIPGCQSAKGLQVYELLYISEAQSNRNMLDLTMLRVNQLGFVQ
ncbi:MAG: hypothetical protein ACJAVV_001058 [Alphaproteobacteria bacterium]|jgi:hypothetical protein